MSGEQAEGQPRRTDPRSFLARGIEGLKNGLLPIAALAYSLGDEGRFAILAGLGLAVLIVGAALAISFLAWTRLTYTVGAEDIRVDSGLLSRTARSVPYDRIQDVSLEQKLVPRLLGLVAIRFETGAGKGEDLSLAYLSEAEGERLRELVRDRRDSGEAGRDIGAGERDCGEERREEAITLFAMSPRRVLTFGLFNFSLVVMAVIGGAAEQFDFLFPFDLWDFDEWEQRLAGPGAWLAGLGAAAQIAGAAIAILVLIVLGVATGVIRTALREWNFRLDRTPRGLRRRRGLLTRTDVMLPVHRVQAQTIATGAVRRRFGWKSLSLVSLASDSGSGNHVVAPFARAEELEPILAVTGFTPPAADLDWHRTADAYRRDRALHRFAAGAFFAVVVLVTQAQAQLEGIAGDPLWSLAPPAFGAAFGLRAWFASRFEAIGLDRTQLHRKGGWLAPWLTTASRPRLNSVEVAQGALARRHGYATLHLGLAGGTLAMDGLPAAAARDLAERLLESMTVEDFAEIGRDQARRSAQSGLASNLAAT